MSKPATQQFVPIQRVRDGVITLKNGELRLILMTSSINLALKGADEQQAVLSQFQSLLNSIEFPLQIFIQSRKLNIKPYMELLGERSLYVKEDLLKVQIREYMGFIKKFTDESNIMTKHFFIVIPYFSPSVNISSGGLTSILPFGKTNHQNITKEENKSFEEGRIQIEERMAVVMQGLARVGIRAQKLGTEEVVELFYKLFNPGEQGGAIKQEQK